MAGKVLNVKGDIIPATDQVIELYARMDDGVIVKGEANIPDVSNHIRKVFYDKKVTATPEAVEAIRKADLILYGIGSVYTSILPNVIIPEIQEALKETKANRVYCCNAMTQPGETDGYSLEDHVQALLDHEQVTTTQLYARHKMNVKRDLVNDMEWEIERRQGTAEAEEPAAAFQQKEEPENE